MSEALGGAGTHGDQVGGARVQTGEHVVGLVPQLGYSAPRAWHVDTWVGRLDALVADLKKGMRISRVTCSMHSDLCTGRSSHRVTLFYLLRVELLPLFMWFCLADGTTTLQQKCAMLPFCYGIADL